jgi:ribosomal protein S27E
MKHICVGCGHTEVNNNATSPHTCRICGEQMLNTWEGQLDDKRETEREAED